MAPNSKSKGGKGSGSAEEPRLVLHQSDHFYESKTKKFHDFLTLEWPATRKVMTVHVGDTLALKYSKARLTTGTWAPFEVPWSAAQVLAIYFTTDDHEYHMIVRWFYRYHEVHSKWDRNLFPKAFQENSIVLESSKVDEHVPMDSVLGRVVLTSSEGNSGIGKKYTRKAWRPVPQVGLECRGYFNFTNKKFQLVDDWDHCGDDDDDEDVTAAAIDASYEISTPFLYRGISCLDGKYRTQLKKHYMNNIAKRRDLVQQQLERAVKKPASKKRASSASSATTLKRTKASAKVEKKGEPVDSDSSSEEEEESVEFLQDALYMSKAKGIEYYYKIRLETSGAIFQVGDLVAVYWKYPDSKTKKTKKNKRWLPFDRQWAAAQILSLERPRERNNDESSCPQMKIRWFSKLSDLSKKMKQDIRAKGMDIGELDVFETTELVECPISSILGSIDMVDRTQCSRKQPPVPLQGSLAVGLPRAQRTCRYSIEKDALVGVCWDTYKSTHLSDPLKRGLKRLHHTLREKTIAAIEHHPSESDESSAMDLDDDDDTSEAAFEQANPTIRPTGEIKTADNRRYYSSVSVPVQIGKCASRFVTKTRSENWELSVGDVVCVEKDNAELPTQGAFGRWQPYEVPWTCCQILSIYSHTSGMDDVDNDDNGGVDEDVFLEVRWFPRASGIDTPELEEMQVSSANEEEIFEAFLVSMDVSAASILGRVNLKLGHHRQSGDPKSASSTIPTVDRRCKSLYFDRERRTQPMFCSDHRPTEWHQRLVERGLKVSKILQADNDLENKVVERFGRKNSENLYADLQECVVSQRENIEGPNLWSDVSSALLLQTTIQPQWHYYAEVDKVCHVNDRSSQLWTIKVGDIIGCQKEDAPVPFAFRNTDNPWFPYTVEWSPCQIIAIYRSKGRTSFEVRWLHIAPGDDNVNQSSSYDIIYETTLPATTTTNMTEEAIIGPLTVIPLTQRASVPFLPLSIHTYGGERPANRAAGEAISFAAMVERGIQASTCYGSRIHWRQVLGKVLHLHQSIDDDDDDGDLITANFETSLSTSKANARDDQTNVTDTFAAFARENSTSDRVEAVENQSISRSILSPGDRSREASSVKKDLQSLLDADNRISTINAPFHVDKSALRAYFTEMAIEPPYEQYSICGEKESKDWIVQLGDIVTVDFVHGSGGTMFDINVAQSANHSPYFRPWAVAEIVAIWRVYETKKDLSNAINRSGANLKGARPARGDLELEIRWVWRKCELQGRMKKQKPSLNEIEELFETDNIDSCTAVSLLGPVKICSSKDEVSPPLYHLGMPVPQFYCSQFWSLHRRRSIPVPSIDGMKGRARMYSPCFTKDNALRRKLTHLEDKRDHTTADVDTSLPAWKGGFQMVIDRLSIAQTLDEGNFGNGVTLIGRQHEQEVLTSFLRTSIRAAHGETNGSGGTVCPSLFVAGPPGTGKSACVFSIVGKLSVEQVKGKLPDFDFVSLNGMEMRHPFEAYVKFWEAISGNVKERLSPELAAVKLERYFTGKIVKDAPKRSVVVLLLDEIDYLVSRKETVLYNFFDWPKRSFDMPKSPRLIVIGISNTMNLPSRLKPSVSSRLGSSRCDFKAYNENEFVTILTSKIQPEKTNYPVFSKDAIIFAARKIGSRTGDLRQALQICKAAAESVLQELEKGTRKDKRAQHQPMVQVRDVANIFRERTGAVISQAITASAPLEVLLLIALAALTQHTGRQGFDIAEVMTKTDSISNSCGIPMYHPPPSFSELLDMLNRLAEARLVRLYTERSSMTTFRAPLGGSGGAWPSIALNVDFTDILAALRSTQHDQLAQKQLGGFSL